MSECLTLVADCMSFSKINIVFQLQSHAQLFATPWTAALQSAGSQSSLSFTISRSLFKLLSIESVMPSNHLILCHPLLRLSSVFLSIRVSSKESVLCMRWPKNWSFSFKITGLICFRIDRFHLLAVQGTLKSSSTPQFKSINYSVLSFLYSPTHTSIHDYWKSHSFD